MLKCRYLPTEEERRDSFEVGFEYLLAVSAMGLRDTLPPSLSSPLLSLVSLPVTQNKIAIQTSLYFLLLLVFIKCPFHVEPEEAHSRMFWERKVLGNPCRRIYLLHHNGNGAFLKELTGWIINKYTGPCLLPTLMPHYSKLPSGFVTMEGSWSGAFKKDPLVGCSHLFLWFCLL